MGNLSDVAETFRTAAGLDAEAKHIDELDEAPTLAEVPDYGDPDNFETEGDGDVKPEAPSEADVVANPEVEEELTGPLDIEPRPGADEDGFGGDAPEPAGEES